LCWNGARVNRLPELVSDWLSVARVCLGDSGAVLLLLLVSEEQKTNKERV